MSKDSGETRVAGTGSIYVAAYGAALPSSFDSTIPSAYAELGFTDEDGVTFTDEPSIDRKRAWQSFHPIRILETDRTAMIAANLLQWNEDTLKIAAGGGTTSAAGTGSKFVPHAAGTLSEWSVIVDISDGSIRDRWVLPKAIVVSSLETTLNRNDLSVMPLELEVIGEEGVNPWEFYTNDTTAFSA